MTEQLWLDPDRKELRIQAAFPRPHGIQMSIAQSLIKIDVFIDQPLRRVGMHIDSDRAPVNGKRLADLFSLISHRIELVSPPSVLNPPATVCETDQRDGRE